MAIYAALHYIAAMQKTKKAIMLNSSEKQVLVLQGGGALGAYQAGAYEALLDAGQKPEWIAGISIGAINSAIIAGNPPEKRVEKLRDFWEKVSSGLQGTVMLPGNEGRTAFNEVSSFLATLYGIPGFFAPRGLPPLLSPRGSPAATSYYDTAPLRATLLDLVDFDLINKKRQTRLSVGAVNVKTGNFRYFDSAEEEIIPEHIMASGALPPAFPSIEIEGEFYWDGGLVSNTPLHQVIDQSSPEENLCIFQVDLFAAEGRLPETIMDTAEREKEIRYSSRTRMNTAQAMRMHQLRNAARNLLKKLPPEMANDPDVKTMAETARSLNVTVMHLINRETAYDTQSKDYEFSRLSMQEHWRDGYDHVSNALKEKAWLNRQIPAKGMVTIDQAKVVQS